MQIVTPVKENSSVVSAFAKNDDKKRQSFSCLPFELVSCFVRLAFLKGKPT